MNDPSLPPLLGNPHTDPQDWTPYTTRIEFETAELLYVRNQMSAGDIDHLLKLWAASLAEHGAEPPFSSHKDLYNTIDSTPLGDVMWESFSIRYNGELPTGAVPEWMSAEFAVWYRDARAVVHRLLSNPDFDGEFDYAPLQEYDNKGRHRFQDFMSGNWAWKQVVRASFSYSHPLFHCVILPRTVSQPQQGQRDQCSFQLF